MEMKLRMCVCLFNYLSTASVVVAPIQNLVTLEETERMEVKTSIFPMSYSFIQAGSQTRLCNGDKHDTHSAEPQLFTAEVISPHEHSRKSKHSLK